MKDSFLDFNEKNWPLLKRNIKKIVGDTAYNNWFKQLSFISIENTTITLSVPTKFLRDWIVNNYADKVKNECKKYIENIEIIKFVVKPNGGRVVPGTARTIKDTDNHWKTTMDIRSNQTSSYPSDFGAPLDPRFNFDNFVVGKPNELAFAASQRVAESQTVTFNPLFLYGGVGLGKTHLMHAIGWKIKEQQPERKVIYLSAEKFMYQFVRALRYKDTSAFKEQFRSIDVLMIDDVQFISGKDNTQEEFFHIFNFLFSTKKQIIFTCDQPPKNIKDLENRLKTRFSQGLNLQLSPPELEMRAAILLKKSQNPQISLSLSEDVALFIASHVTSNVRDLEGALLKLKAFVDFSRIDHSSISKDVVEGALGDLISPKKRLVEINEVQKTVSKYYGITVSDLISSSRKQHLVRARQMAIYLCHNLTALSLSKIGQNFGNRDHSTVLYSCEKVKELMKNKRRNNK